MVKLDAIPLRRSFLPPSVVLNSNSGRETADFSTIPDRGLPHGDVVVRLGAFQGTRKPVVCLGDNGATSFLPMTDGKDELKALRELGYAPDRCRDFLVRYHEASALPDDLNGMVALGYGLNDAAWTVAGPERRTLAWDRGTLAQNGPWAKRATAGEEHALVLRRELRAAIRMAEHRSVHLTPLIDGSLRARVQRFDADDGVHAWEAHEGGCGMLAIGRCYDQLNAYATSDGWLAWYLQRSLLDAWAEEALGENVPWHWGV